MTVHRKTLLLSSLLCILALFQVMASCISFTNDRPKSDIQKNLDNDVTLGWTCSYSDSKIISSGPWNAPEVQEISFGIWEYKNDKAFLTKKLVVVDSHGNFTWRSGYAESKIDWSYSKYKLTFTLKRMKADDQATYGLHVELGLNHKPLEHYVNVMIGASYVGQDEKTAVRNETGYLSETIDLLYKRSPKKEEGRSYYKYIIYKGDVTVIILGKQSNRIIYTCAKDELSVACKERYSLRLFNDTFVAFQLRNLTQDDAGRYVCQKYFLGVKNDPEYEEINLDLQERPTTQTSEGSSTRGHDKSTPKAKGGYSDPSSLLAAWEIALIILAVIFVFFLAAVCVYMYKRRLFLFDNLQSPNEPQQASGELLELEQA